MDTVGTLIENVHVVSGVQNEYSTAHSEAVQETNFDRVETTPTAESPINQDTEAPESPTQDTEAPESPTQDTEAPESPNQDTEAPESLNQDTEAPESLNQDTGADVLVPSTVSEVVNDIEIAQENTADQQDTTATSCNVDDLKETAEHPLICRNVVVENPQLGTLKVLHNACTLDDPGNEYSEVSVSLAHHVIDVQDDEEEEEEEDEASKDIFMSFDEEVAEGDEHEIHYEAYI